MKLAKQITDRYLRLLATALLASALIAACSPNGNSGPKADSSGEDATETTDAGDDASTDAGDDATTDAGDDATTDAGDDATTDAGDDATTDIGDDVEDTIVQQCNESAVKALYEQRIEPLVSGEKPSTCNQCHLSGVDLGMFAQDTPCQSMACMIKLDLVDLNAPEESAILEQIMLAEPESELITQQVIQEEHDGFLEWIQYSAQCHASLCGEIADPCNSGTGAPTSESAVVYPLGESCEEAAVGAAFESLVYSWKGRCQGCHAGANDTPNACNPGCPAGKICKTVKGEAKCVVIAPYWVDMNFTKGDPKSISAAALRTMYNLIGLGSFDVESPVDSLLVTKPLDEAEGGVYHGGGAKIKNKAEQTYIDYMKFLQTYAACYTGSLIGQVPQVIIKSPGDGATLQANQPFTFKGWAMDPEDGEINSKQGLTWTSSLLAEPLGTGWKVVASLPAGNHTITLMAIDSDDNVAVGSISVTFK